MEAAVTTPAVSIKNPLAGSRITVPAVGEIIRNIQEGTRAVQVQNYGYALFCYAAFCFGGLGADRAG